MWMPPTTASTTHPPQSLVKRGVPLRLAQEAVGKAVALAVERGCDLQKLPLVDLQVIHLQVIHASFDAAFHSSLGLTEVLALHDVPGGAAPRHVKRALQNARERAVALRSREQIATR
jgi:argininosuccinate lyase